MRMGPHVDSIIRRHFPKETCMSIARGHFDVTIEAEPPFLEQDGNRINHNLVRKEFYGDMVGKSEAHMVAAHTGTPGSAAYVAIEHFAGSVGGKSGTLVLVHSGTMSSGEAELSVTIIPDSGTGELAGVSGSMEIDSSDGKHAYVLSFRRP